MLPSYNEEYSGGGVTPFSLSLRKEMIDQESKSPDINFVEKAAQGVQLGSALQESQEIRQFKEVLKQGKAGAKATIEKLKREGIDTSTMPNPDLIRTGEDLEGFYETVGKLTEAQQKTKRELEGRRKTAEALSSGDSKKAFGVATEYGIDAKNIQDMVELETKQKESQAKLDTESKGKKSFIEITSKYANKPSNEASLNQELDELTRSESADSPQVKARMDAIKTKLQGIENEKKRYNDRVLADLKLKAQKEDKENSKKSEAEKSVSKIDLITNAAKTLKGEGFFIGNLKKWASNYGTFNDVKLLKDYTTAFAPELAKMGGESGRLSNQDIQYALTAAPDTKDSPDLFDAKVKMLEALSDIQKGYYQGKEGELKLRRIIIENGIKAGRKPQKYLPDNFSNLPDFQKIREAESFLMSNGQDPSEENVNRLIQNYQSQKQSSGGGARANQNPQAQSTKASKLAEIDAELEAIKNELKSGR